MINHLYSVSALLLALTASADDAGAARKMPGPPPNAYEAACDQGVKTACYAMRNLLGDHPPPPADELETARTLAVKECTAGAAAACDVLGRFWHLGAGGAKNEAKAGDLIRKACELGWMPSCNSIALEQVMGEPTDKDATAALSLFERSCLGGFSEACDNLGTAWVKGVSGHAADPAKARPWFDKGCKGGFHKSCIVLAAMYLKGIGGQRDTVAAMAAMKDVCTLPLEVACRSLPEDPKGCRSSVQSMCTALTDDPPDKKDHDCNAGVLQACFSLGTSYLTGTMVKQDDVQALHLFEKACEAGHANACSAAAAMYAASRGFDAAQLSKVVDDLRKKCDGGHATGCYFLSAFYLTGRGVPKDRVHAVELLQRALSKGCVAAASFLGESYARGEGVAQSDAKAVETLTRGCSGHESHSCYSLGLLYEMGRGVKADPAKAKELYRQACDNGTGYTKACEN